MTAWRVRWVNSCASNLPSTQRHGSCTRRLRTGGCLSTRHGNPISRVYRCVASAAVTTTPTPFTHRHIHTHQQRADGDPSIGSGHRALTGIAASGGRVTGRARVILSPHEATTLQAGDILVTRSTDSGWTPVFALISGVVLEISGQLSYCRRRDDYGGWERGHCNANCQLALQMGRRLRWTGEK